MKRIGGSTTISMMNPFKEVWRILMGKETTTTYTVTVKHPGPKKSFDEVFKTRRNAKIQQTACVTTNTVKTEPVPRFSPEQKITRTLFKKACEDAGLTYSRDKLKLGEYYLDYAFDWRIESSYDVVFHEHHFKFQFPDGVGKSGNIVHYYAGKRDTLSTEINLTDPKTYDMLVELFKKFGK